MKIDFEAFKENSAKDYTRLKRFLSSLKKQKPSVLDASFHQLHEEVFEQTNCLDCANCCKTTSPIFLDSDIDRIARFLRLKPGSFIEKYLKMDEDGDYVLQKSPCSFLGSDNHCMIYAHRPRACREYPHTNRRKMSQLLQLTAKNTRVCPAVHEIVLRLEREQSGGK